MKRIIFFVLIICALGYGCKKDSLPTYNSQDNISVYYPKYPVTDSTIYSFAYTLGIDRDTVWVPITISGKRVNHARSFQLSVVPGSTTAVRNLHYEVLKPSYTMPADSGLVHVPVIIKNTDTGLTAKSVVLVVRVSGGADFGSGLPEDLRSKKIYFSNRLEQPAWWKYWLGQYSRVKHQLFLISSGTTALIDLSLPDAYLQIPRTLFYVENMRVFLNYPFDWVKQNPSKGYVLVQRTDGTGDYDFYNVNTPNKKFYLKYFKAANKYVFIDESGNQISV